MNGSEKVDALVAALEGTEASRRAGWASSFAASEKVEEALRELNLMRADRDIFRTVASYLDGYLTGLNESVPGLSQTQSGAQIKRYREGVAFTADRGPFMKARADAREATKEWVANTEASARLHEARAEQKRARNAASRETRDLMSDFVRQYHAPAGLIRLCLRALREAIKGNGVARASGPGWIVTLRVDRA